MKNTSTRGDIVWVKTHSRPGTIIDIDSQNQTVRVEFNDTKALKTPEEVSCHFNNIVELRGLKSTEFPLSKMLEIVDGPPRYLRLVDLADNTKAARPAVPVKHNEMIHLAPVDHLLVPSEIADGIEQQYRDYWPDQSK